MSIQPEAVAALFTDVFAAVIASLILAEALIEPSQLSSDHGA